MDRIYHQIIDKPHEYDVEFFSFSRDKYLEDSIVELHLEKNGNTIKLKFTGVRDLSIEKGFPSPTRGMFIEDVSSHQMEGVNIYLGDAEVNGGAITFWARKVEKID